MHDSDVDRARLAQSVEHQTFNLRVVGSSPTLGAAFEVSDTKKLPAAIRNA